MLTVARMGDRAWALKINETRHQWLDDEAATILEETQMKMGHVSQHCLEMMCCC